MIILLKPFFEIQERIFFFLSMVNVLYNVWRGVDGWLLLWVFVLSTSA